MATYTPGDSRNVSDFMARRTLESHGAFFLPYLATGLSVLDCGCGPGSITVGIAARVAPGEVVGIDCAQSQIERARVSLADKGGGTVGFETGDTDSLPFENGRFDRAFSHALMEHVADPVRALRELHRVLKPGGVIGICSPDWGGFMLSPPSPDLSRAVEVYMALQSSHGGDVGVGRKLGLHLTDAGFDRVRMSARYECYAPLQVIGEYLAFQLEREGDKQSASVFREWSRKDEGLFAQAWVSAVGVKPQ